MRSFHVPLRRLALAVGCVTLAIALLSPLHAEGRSSFAAHMMQHELLMVVATPLLILGCPDAIADWLSSTGMLRQPTAICALHAVAIWIWHVPSFYDAATTNELVHGFQHLSFVGTALLFWWSVFHPAPGQRATGAALVSLIVTAAHTGVLGALLTFAPMPLYHVHVGATAAALEDQQLAGLIMWIPAGFVYVAAILGVTFHWLHPAPLERPPDELRRATVRV